MKKFELIEALAENDGNPEIEILMQTKIDGDYVNLCTKDIVSVEDDEETIIIRCHEK